MLADSKQDLILVALAADHAASGELADRDRCYAEQVYLTLRLIHRDLFDPALEFTLRMVGSKVSLGRVRGLLFA